MIFSRDRILTTHVGSLPRNEKLSELLVPQEAGEPCDTAELSPLNRDRPRSRDYVRRSAVWRRNHGYADVHYRAERQLARPIYG